jgi:hypothetical protein
LIEYTFIRWTVLPQLLQLASPEPPQPSSSTCILNLSCEACLSEIIGATQDKSILLDDIAKYLIKYYNDNTIHLDLKHPMSGQITKYILNLSKSF